MPLFLALLLPAHAAAPAAWYSTDRVADLSTRFQAAAEELGPRYSEVESALRRLSPAIEDLDLATALAGASLSSRSTAYSREVRAQAVAARAAAQQHVDLVQDGYTAAFGAALDRALAEVGATYAVQECEGGGLQAMMGRAARCEGEDLGPALAERLDQDATLAAEIAAINSQPWPSPTVSGSAQPVLSLTGSGGYLQLAPVARALWEERLVARSDDLDRVVAPLEEAIAAGDAQALARAEEARAAYERALSADGQVLLPLLGEALGRLKGKAGADVGLCVNPEQLGGCPGQDRTADLLPMLVADRKLSRAISSLP